MVGKNELPTLDVEASLSSPRSVIRQLTHVETILGELNTNLLEVQLNMVMYGPHFRHSASCRKLTQEVVKISRNTAPKIAAPNQELRQKDQEQHHNLLPHEERHFNPIFGQERRNLYQEDHRRGQQDYQEHGNLHQEVQR